MFSAFTMFPAFLLAISAIFLSSADRILLPNNKHATSFVSTYKCVADEPLFLTPFVRNNQTGKGRLLSRVYLPHQQHDVNFVSYAGFITVNDTDNSNTFFWLFDSTDSKNNTPLILWLQGGPGASSLYGLFNEHGPYFVDDNFELRQRAVSWTSLSAVLYVDNPVGTGFSFTSTNDGYARNEVQIGWNLFKFLVQFYEIYPEFVSSPLYIAGESYAGKYVPALAYRIHEQNVVQKNKISLVGLAIGNGFSDPENMIDISAPLMFSFGMADSRELVHVQKIIGKVKSLILQNRFLDAFWENDQLFDGLLPKDQPTYMQNITGTSWFYNILQSQPPPGETNFISYIQKCDVRNAIHVGNLTFNSDGGKVEKFLLADVLDTVRYWLAPTLFDNYRVMFYNGQLDVAVGAAMTKAFLRRLNASLWTWKQEYLDAPKQIWKVSGDVAGYVKSVRNGQFVQAVVRNAGHLVPYDQPVRCFDLYKRFLHNESFEN